MYFKRVPQWELLNRSNMISFENNFRLCQLSKLNKILLNPIPIWEFHAILETLEYPGRSRDSFAQVIPKLNPRPIKQRHLPDDFFTTSPAIWLDIFETLPSFLKCHLGTNLFSKLILDFFRAICQHGECKDEICENCMLNRRSYRNVGFQKIKSENLRANNYTIDSNFSMINKQLIIETKLLTNFFYKGVSAVSNWFNEDIADTRNNFALIGPCLE